MIFLIWNVFLELFHIHSKVCLLLNVLAQKVSFYGCWFGQNFWTTSAACILEISWKSHLRNSRKIQGKLSRKQNSEQS